MKLFQGLAKLTVGRRRILSMLGGFAIAGAACTAAAPAAQAQVSFGVAIGGPRYYAPAPQPVYVTPGYAAYGYGGGYARGYGDYHRDDAWRAREFRGGEVYDHHVINRYDNRHYDDQRFNGRGWR